LIKVNSLRTLSEKLVHKNDSGSCNKKIKMSNHDCVQVRLSFVK